MEITKHSLSTFYPDIPPDTLKSFSDFVKASFGQEPDPSQFSTRADFEKKLLSQVEDELHKAPLTEETIEKCAFFVFNFLLDDEQFDYNNMYDVATQVHDLAALLRAPDWIDDPSTYKVAAYGRLFLWKDNHDSAWYGIPEGGEKIREELFFLIDQKFFRGNVVPPIYQCDFSERKISGTLHRHVCHSHFTDNDPKDRSSWDAPNVRMNALLHLLVNYQDESPLNYGVSQGRPPFRFVSFDGESILSPKLRVGPRRHPFLVHPATNAILNDPFSPEEMALIDAIEPKKLGSFLRARNIEEIAIFFTSCALQTIRRAIARQRERAENPITLRDLLVISNISGNPNEFSWNGQKLPGNLTCFHRICQSFNRERFIALVFEAIVQIKAKVDSVSSFFFLLGIDYEVIQIKWQVRQYYRTFKVTPS